MQQFFKKIQRKFQKWYRRYTHLRLQSIHVYCLHHVCGQFDAATMHASDWMALDDFQQKVLAMQQSGVCFISLSRAYRLLKNDFLRLRKYAVLTFDDGYASLMEVLPWLQEQHIPCTLFINGKYTDSASYRDNPKEKYLIREELASIIGFPAGETNGRGLVEIYSHGWEHTNATKVPANDFGESVEKNVLFIHAILPSHMEEKDAVFFHAYTWGAHTTQTDAVLYDKNIVPVLMDGMKNYNDITCIHRELL